MFGEGRGGVCPGLGVSALGGVYQGDVCPGGVCLGGLPGGVCRGVSAQCMLGYTPLG